MSRALMTLLGRPREKMLEIAFDDLEKSTGCHAIDAKLVGDILHRAHLVIRAMGLDGDVTAQELYHALRVHDDLLDEQTAYIGLVVGGSVISFNADDIITDNSSANQYESRSLAGLRHVLAGEIKRRYEERAAHAELLAPITKYLQETRMNK